MTLQPARPESSLGFERIASFSDAVMAIAITLLAIDLKMPELPTAAAAAELPRALTAMSPHIMSFIISFVVIRIYWTSHHRYFGYIQRYDGRLITLNLMFLLFIASMPFVTSVLGQYWFLSLGVMIYAAAVAATRPAMAAVWWYATRRHRLVAADLDDGFIRLRNRIALLVPLIILASIPVASANPLMAMTLWWTAPLVALGCLRWFKRRRLATKPHR
jgi:uncharacterized membrane protein